MVMVLVCTSVSVVVVAVVSGVIVVSLETAEVRDDVSLDSRLDVADEVSRELVMGTKDDDGTKELDVELAEDVDSVDNSELRVTDVYAKEEDDGTSLLELRLELELKVEEVVISVKGQYVV